MSQIKKIIFFEKRELLQKALLFSFDGEIRLDKKSKQNLFNVFECTGKVSNDKYLLVAVKNIKKFNSENIKQIFLFLKSNYIDVKKIYFANSSVQSNKVIYYSLLKGAFSCWKDVELFNVLTRRVNESFESRIKKSKSLSSEECNYLLNDVLHFENEKFLLCMLLAKKLNFEAWEFFLFFLFLSLFRREKKNLNVFDFRQFSENCNVELEELVSYLQTMFEKNAISEPFGFSHIRNLNELNLNSFEMNIYYEIRNIKNKQTVFLDIEKNLYNKKDVFSLFAKRNPTYAIEFEKLINFLIESELIIEKQENISLTKYGKKIYEALRGKRIEELIN